MKITYLHQYFNTPSMHGGTRSYEMARRLVKKGHRVEMITTIRDKGAKAFNSVEDGIYVHWLPVHYSNEMSFLARVWAFLKFSILSTKKSLSIDSDVVFATSTPLTIIIPGVLTKWFKKIPLVFEVRDVWPAVPIAMGILKSPFLVFCARLLEEFAYIQSEKIVALAPGMKDEITSKGIDHRKVIVIENGCDRQYVDQITESDLDALKRDNLWLSNRKVIFYAGTFGRANGVDFVVKVATEMLNIDDTIVFVLMGEGSEKEKIYREAERLGVLNVNLYILDAVPKKEVFRWIMISDFTLGLFRGPRILWKDAVQNKFFDSIAAGKPVACNFKGYQSIIAEENQCGVILSHCDHIGAAKMLCEKIHDSDWIENAKIKALKLSRDIFSRDKLADKLDAVFLSVF